MAECKCMHWATYTMRRYHSPTWYGHFANIKLFDSSGEPFKHSCSLFRFTMGLEILFKIHKILFKSADVTLIQPDSRDIDTYPTLIHEILFAASQVLLKGLSLSQKTQKTEGKSSTKTTRTKFR